LIKNYFNWKFTGLVLSVVERKKMIDYL